MFTIEEILDNSIGVRAVVAMPAMADVFSGIIPLPTPCPAEAKSVGSWIDWFVRSAAYTALRQIFAELGINNVVRGDKIWGEDGYLLPGQQPHCGPCQFEFSKLIAAGADGGCLALICSAPNTNGFGLHIGTNIDATRLLLWPENIGLGRFQGTPDTDSWLRT